MTSETIAAVKLPGEPESQVIEPDHSVAGTVRSRDFSWFWGAFTVSTFGDQVTMVALPLAVFARTGSALAVGIAASMQSITAVLLGLFAGALADRLRHRPVLIVTDLIRGILLGGLAVALIESSSSYPVTLLYVAAFLLGALRVLNEASSAAALPLVVRGRDLLRANGRLSASESAGNAGGPALAGALKALVRPSRSAGAGALPVGADIREGIRALRADRLVLKAAFLIAAMNVMAVAVEAQFIPYAKSVLHLSGLVIGVYFAIGGLAGVVTSFVVGRNERTRGDVMIAGVAIFGLGVLIAGVWPSRATALVAYLCAGAGSVMAVTHWYSLRQRRFPVRLLGRVTVATRIILFGPIPVAYVVGGALARSEGSETLFVVAACVGLAAAAWMFLTGLGSLRVSDAVSESAVEPTVG